MRTKDVSITVDIRLNEDDKVITKGPFNLKMPIKLSKDDRYRFILYTLLDSGFRPQSGEYISHLGGSITSLKKIDLKDVRMGYIHYTIPLVDERCNGGRRIKQRKGRCVQDYIYEEIF